MNAPTETSATANSLVIGWNAITSNADTGASAITSYQLDQFDGISSWLDLKGFSSDDTALTYTVSSLTAGNSYKFRLRAKNSYGWGPYSSEVTMVPSAVPSTMVAPTTSNVGTNV